MSLLDNNQSGDQEEQIFKDEQPPLEPFGFFNPVRYSLYLSNSGVHELLVDEI